jgi:diguanylate cyclase (GGDEF)-like protein/PAS domain S-box-containing protein
MEGEEIWAVFMNLELTDSRGLETLDRLSLAAPGLPALVIVGADEENIGLEALKRGAKDYILENHLDRNALVRAIRNMAERQKVEEVLFTEKERAQVTLNSIGDAVLSIDAKGAVTYLNAVAEKMTGWSLEEAFGKPLNKVFHIIDGHTREDCLNPTLPTINNNKTTVRKADSILIRRDGSECIIEDSAAPIHDRHGQVTGAVIVFHDVSVTKAMGLEMSHLANHDALINLPNRNLLKDRLNQAIATSHRTSTWVAVLYIDLDGFKHINDSLGHAIGDKLLQSVAKRLLACVRTSDTVSRLGGDEFVVLLSETKVAQGAGISARKILNALAAPHEIDQHSLCVSTSIGVTTYPEDGQDAEVLIRNADMAMYQAKEKAGTIASFLRLA